MLTTSTSPVRYRISSSLALDLRSNAHMKLNPRMGSAASRFSLSSVWLFLTFTAIWATTEASSVAFTSPQESLEAQSGQLLILTETISQTFETQQFLTYPYQEYLQETFSPAQLQSNCLDLVVICKSDLTPIMGMAYNRKLGRDIHVDPELKLTLTNNPVFRDPKARHVAILMTSRGKMLLSFHPIQSVHRNSPDGYLILGRLLDSDILDGARLVSLAHDQPRATKSWPDVFGQPAFAFATIP